MERNGRLKTEIRIYPLEDGEIQRVQIVRLNGWSPLDFLSPDASDSVFSQIVSLYRQFIVPVMPWIFGRMILFSLPEGVPVPDMPGMTGRVETDDRLTKAAFLLNQYAVVRNAKIYAKEKHVRTFVEDLDRSGSIGVVCGKLPFTKIIPVGGKLGFLSETEKSAAFKCNAPFFIMDSFDCATPFDHVGTPVGLMVKNGVILNPPLYRREALLVRHDGTSSVEIPDIRTLEIGLGGKKYLHGRNAELYTRPFCRRTKHGRGWDTVIIGNRVAGVCARGYTPVPASGFVMRTPERIASPGETAVFYGMEDIQFGIQTGNSTVVNGTRTESFVSSFYNIRDPRQRVPYPPSLYPHRYEQDHAARMALGSDENGNPVVIWAEGAAKIGHEPGKDSRGATLLEMSHYCMDAGIVNGINLDGGGSAQILVENGRSLLISDRNRNGLSEMERAVPLGLIVR
ncbi:MAG: phosphodiester glycosidase family protein [Clostridia bacterium]|nr:phosphodiester glycosidase family protein [Clostridia bacterium]